MVSNYLGLIVSNILPLHFHSDKVMVKTAQHIIQFPNTNTFQVVLIAIMLIPSINS